jgi:CHASE2 domain-containing sensor protein
MRGRRVLLLLAVAALAGAATALLYEHHVLRRAEQLALDARYAIRGTDRAKLADLVVVNVDDRTFSEFRDEGKRSQWPFPRRYHARVIDRLRRAGAKVIAFDVQFTERTNEVDDVALIDAVGRAGNAVLSTTIVGPHGTTNVLGGDDVLRELGARAGDTSVIPDSDGAIRTTQYEIQGLETFGVAVSEAATGRRVSAASFGGPRNPVPIDYAGPPGTVRALSYSRVYDGRFPRDAVAGKVVIVGAGATSLQDLHQTPASGGAPMAGTELLANTSSTVLRGLPLRDAPGWVTALLIAAGVLLPCVAAVRLGALGVALTGLALLAAWSVAAQVAFDSGTVLDYSDPAAALLLATAGTAIVGLWFDNRERRRLRELFAADAAGVVEDVLRPSGPRALEPTAIIAGYRIEAVVGRGGMGVVYRASQLALERPVAIKLIATERAQDPVFRERFEREARLAASIEHVNVIPVYEAGEDDGLLYIVMRLVDGIDLAAILDRGGALEPARAARLVGQLAAALDAAHARGLVHRDVKPANVLLTLDEPEHLYLTDFGVAREVGAGAALTNVGGWVGTLDYLAPEQIRGETAGAAGDVYALAGLLHHCLTGEVPFPRDSEAAKLWAHVNAPPPAPSALRPDLPAAIDDVIARGLAKEPGERYRSATELARACAAALGVAAVSGAAAPRERSVIAETGPVTPTVVSD